MLRGDRGGGAGGAQVCVFVFMSMYVCPKGERCFAGGDPHTEGEREIKGETDRKGERQRERGRQTDRQRHTHM